MSTADKKLYIYIYILTDPYYILITFELILGFFISLFAGLLGSMVGIGGGIINTPYISLFSNIPAQISSTSLMSVLSTSISSTYFYFKKKLVDQKIGSILAISAIPGTYFGVIFTKIMSIENFKIFFAFILIGTAIYLVIKTKIHPIDIRNKEEKICNKGERKSSINILGFFLLILFAFLSGIISSSFGIGGGVIFVPCMVIILGFKMKVAAATSQFALMFTSLSGLILYIIQGSPNYSLGIVLSLGSIIGGILGSSISTKINSDLLQKIFSLVLILVSIKLFYDVYI